MVDKNLEQQSEEIFLDVQPQLDGQDQELTEEDLDAIDGADGGQPTYPPYL
jgi:hypothetical protein